MFFAPPIKRLALLFIASTGILLAEEGRIGEGEWATSWYLVDSGKPGPTVLVTGGIHGNEPAGSHAAEQIRHWPLAKGRLLVLPRVNRLGLKANLRWVPAWRNDRDKRDLNRNFPRADRPQPETPLATELWELIKKTKPDWAFDLHEGFDFNRINAKSVGSSVIAFPAGADFARRLQQVVNAEVAPERQFTLRAKTGPVQGSLARACSEQLGAQSFILETTFKEQALSLRARQHRIMMSTALLRIGLIEADCVDRLAPPARAGLIRVGLFDDAGANEAKVLKVLVDQPGISVVQLGPRDMKPAVLESFELLLFPGGSGSKQGRALGEEGRDAVRGFARAGGGILGICAGAFLCSSHYDWSLHLFNASVFNQMVEVPGKGRRSMWYRGPATDIDVDIVGEGSRILGLHGTHAIRYQNGPILSPGKHPELPAYTPLAWFRSENGIYEAQKGSMIGAPAVVSAQYGQGRVLAVSPHFESTPGQEAVLRRAVEYLARRGHGR